MLMLMNSKSKKVLSFAIAAALALTTTATRSHANPSGDKKDSGKKPVVDKNRPAATWDNFDGPDAFTDTGSAAIPAKGAAPKKADKKAEPKAAAKKAEPKVAHKADKKVVHKADKKVEHPAVAKKAEAPKSPTVSMEDDDEEVFVDGSGKPVPSDSDQSVGGAAGPAAGASKVDLAELTTERESAEGSILEALQLQIKGDKNFSPTKDYFFPAMSGSPKALGDFFEKEFNYEGIVDSTAPDAAVLKESKRLLEVAKRYATASWSMQNGHYARKAIKLRARVDLISKKLATLDPAALKELQSLVAQLETRLIVALNDQSSKVAVSDHAQKPADLEAGKKTSDAAPTGPLDPGTNEDNDLKDPKAAGPAVADGPKPGAPVGPAAPGVDPDAAKRGTAAI